MDEKFPFSVESSRVDRIEHAESLEQLLEIVGEIIGSEKYADTEQGGAELSKANRAGIAKFGRRAYFTAFDEAFGPGLAGQYMRPPEDNE